MIALMRVFYNGYTFLPNAKGALYNPTLTLYFLDKLQLDREPPQKLLDVNLAMDRNKLEYIAGRPGGEAVILQLMEDQPPLTVREIYDRFSLGDLVQPAQEAVHLASLLYTEGEMQPLCTFMAEGVYRSFSNRDYRHANELTVKALFLSLLYNDLIYITDSEPELERRYADLLMLLRPESRPYPMFDILIEFKYVELSKVELNAEGVRRKTTAELAALDIIKAEFVATRSALQAYRQTLQTKYSVILKLRVYAVVSLGFERVLWEEVP